MGLGLKKVKARIVRSTVSRVNVECTSVYPVAGFEWTEEQKLVFDTLRNSRKHLIIKACAGSGKTTTLTHGLTLVNEGVVGYMAFSKHNAVDADEALKRVGARASGVTFHSAGFAVCRQHLGGVRVELNNVYKIMDGMGMTSRKYGELRGTVRKVVGLMKGYVLEPDEDSVDYVMDMHDLYVEKAQMGTLVSAVREVMRVGRDPISGTGEIDYDDMIWLPVVNGWRGSQYDLLVLDEAQDANECQMRLVMGMVEGDSGTSGTSGASGRLVAIGDPWQAIFGFRGAGIGSMDKIEARLLATERGVEELKLTYSNRVPKLHARLAQHAIGCKDVQATRDAPEGSERGVDVLGAKVGDMVLCRVNAPLLGEAFRLLRAGVPVCVKGQDFGKALFGVADAAKQLGGSGLDGMFSGLWSWVKVQEAKLKPLGDKAENRLALVHDKAQCLSELLEGIASKEGKDSMVDYHSKLVDAINTLFATQDRDKVVTFGTVHRTKGLESERVWILRPDLIPHPIAAKRGGWELAQERNLALVAITRVKKTGREGYGGGEVVWVGKGRPQIYGVLDKGSSEKGVV